MKDTGLKATKKNLLELVKNIATPETLKLIAMEIDECKTLTEQVEWFMNCFFCFAQPYIIVKINTTGTWGLIHELDNNGDNEEYLDLLNDNLISDWHE